MHQGTYDINGNQAAREALSAEAAVGIVTMRDRLAFVDGPEPVIHDHVTAGGEGSAQLSRDLFEDGTLPDFVLPSGEVPPECPCARQTRSSGSR